MDPTAFILNKNDPLIAENTFHSDGMTGKEIGVDKQKAKNFKYSEPHKLPSPHHAWRDLNLNRVTGEEDQHYPF